MSNRFLNIALGVTAAVAVIVLIVFFVKLNNISPSDEKNEGGTEQTEKDNPLNILTGKQADNTATQEDKNQEATPSPDTEVSPTDAVITEEPSLTEAAEPSKAEEDNNDTPKTDTGKSGIDPEKPIVALSFDDGPSAQTESILATLEKYGAHATFFTVGENIDLHPDKIKKIYESGCEIGNHTVSHANLNKLSKDDILKEIDGNQEKLNATLGTSLNFLVRPPYGNVNDTVKAACTHPMINWSVDTLDWKSRDADAVFEEVKKSTKDGSIILMHDLYSSTAEAVKKVVPWLVEQGYQICSVSEMFEARGVKLENGKVYNSCMNAEKYKENK